MEQQAREQAFISALTTEQFVLQAARSANVGEMTGRATVYMGTVSSALIAFGFLAQVVTRLDPFVAAVLPGVFLLGEFTFAALLRNTLENLVLLRQMQRIRGYYRTLGARGRPVLRPSRGGGAVLGCDGHGRAAGPAGGDAVHRGERDRHDQQHRGWDRRGFAGRQGREPGHGRRADDRHHRRRGPVRAAPAVPAAASRVHGPAATGPGIIDLVVEVDADDDQHDQDGGGDPVDDQAERPWRFNLTQRIELIHADASLS
jgi:hypothetical protein